MAEEHRISVLRQYQPYQHLFEAFNYEHFCDKNYRDLINNIGYAVCVAVLLFLATVVAILCSWYCVDIGWNIDILSISIAAILLTFFCIVTHIILLTKNRVIRASIDYLQETVDERMRVSAGFATICHRIEARHATIARMIFRSAKLTFPGAFALSLMFPILYVCFGYPAPDKWILPVGIHSIYERGPFVGYFIDISLEIGFAAEFYSVLVPMALLLIGLCAYIDGMAHDLKTQITGPNVPNRMDNAQIFINEIRFHYNIIGVVNNIQRIIGDIIFCQLLTCAIMTGINLFSLESHNFFTIYGISSMYDLVVVLLMTFANCYMSETLTSSMNEIGSAFNDMAWYRLPIKAQMLMIPVVQYGQHEFRLNGMGFGDCSFEVFGKIIRSAGSYFLFIRKLK